MSLGYSYINASPSDTITSGFFKFDDNTRPSNISFSNTDCNNLNFTPFSILLVNSMPDNKLLVDIYTSGSYFMGSYYVDISTENNIDGVTTYDILEYSINSDITIFNNPVYILLRAPSSKGQKACGLLVTSPGPTGIFNSSLTISGTGPTGTNVDSYLRILGPTGTFLTSFDKTESWFIPRITSFNVSGNTVVNQSGSATLSALSLTTGSNDMAGSVSATLGGLGTGSIVLTITFGKPYSVIPQNVSLTGGNLHGGSAAAYIQNLSTTSFEIVVGAALLVVGTVYKFFYHVIG